MIRATSPLIPLAISLFAIGCSSQQKTSQEQGTEISATERSEYEGTAEHKLAQIGARIDSLNGELARAGDRAKVETRQQAEELKVKRDALAHKLDELRAAGGQQWRTLKLQTADLIDDLEKKLDEMSQRLRNQG